MADQRQVSASADELDRGPIDGRGLEPAAHFEVVGYDQSLVADAPPQNVGDPSLRERRRQPVAGDRRVIRVADQNHGQLALHHLVGKQVFRPELLKALIDHRQIVMRIQIAFAESGEMFARSDDTGRREAGEKFPRK